MIQDEHLLDWSNFGSLDYPYANFMYGLTLYAFSVFAENNHVKMW